MRISRRTGCTLAGAVAAGAVSAAVLGAGVTPASALDSVLGNADRTVQIDAVTDEGKTLGRVPATDGRAIDSKDLPDYLYTYGDSGKPGYVSRSDLDLAPEPASPAQALEWQEKGRVVLVYAADGKTVVDRKTISPASESTQRLGGE